MERSREVFLQLEGRPCLICGSTDASGFLVLRERICGPCGDQIALLRVGDPHYEFYKEKLK
ncbi:MAG: sigma factor G inhibitor Gin, partial [Bacillota bacterium]|nr:sigma factor G inhibitor Gin [Bacillota bacterium]